MEYGLYISAAGLQTQEYRQGVFANNLANAQTVGFKRDLAILQSRRSPALEDPTLAKYRSAELGQLGGGVLAAPTGIDLTPSTLLPSANKTDVALEGAGFFTVEGTQPGQKLLTRNGQFLINDKNELVTANSGQAVLDTGGNHIVVNPALPLAISANGQIRQEDAAGAQLGVVDVKDGKGLQKLGNNLFSVQDPSTLQAMPAATRVRQGNLETSGVDPMIELVNMMQGQRVFEANAKMITYQDTMLSEVNAVGRIA